MKSVHEVVQSVAQSLSALQEQFDTLRQMQQDFDRQVNAIYHEIEISNFNARDGYKYAKRLQDVLRQRRLVKAQLSSVQHAVNYVKPRDLIENVQKIAESCRRNVEETCNYLGIESAGE